MSWRQEEEEAYIFKQSIRKNIQTYKETKNMNDVFFKTCVKQLETLLDKVEKLDKGKVKTPLNPALKTLLMSAIPSVK